MKGVEVDLAKLEQALRKLEYEYDQFLSGQLRVEPVKAEADVLGLIRSYGTKGIQNSSMRFKYNNIVARYNAFRKVWTRRVREREEGRVIGRPWRAASGRPPSRTAPPAAAGKDFITRGLKSDESGAGEIFSAYKHLRKECGESTDRLRQESFTRILNDKVEKMKKLKKCDQVEICLSREKDKCRIIVRPVRGSD